MKYYTFNLKLDPVQVQKVKDIFDECIGADLKGSGLFFTISFKDGALRGMIMPPDTLDAFRPALNGVLAACEKDELGML
jgi:hypothetical protein